MAWYDVSELFRGRPYVYDPDTNEIALASRMKPRAPRSVNGSKVHSAAGTTRTCAALNRHVDGRVPTC